MSRFNESFHYFTILDGASIANEDTSNASTQYYGYTRPAGSWIIMKVLNADGDNTSYGFFIGADVPAPFTDSDLANYDIKWIARAGLNYKRAGEFKSL